MSPQVNWYYGTTNITGDNNHILNEPVTQGTVTSRTLIFKSLRTSLAGMYECRASIKIPSVNISSVANNSIFQVVVKGIYASLSEVLPSISASMLMYASLLQLLFQW